MQISPPEDIQRHRLSRINAKATMLISKNILAAILCSVPTISKYLKAFRSTTYVTRNWVEKNASIFLLKLFIKSQFISMYEIIWLSWTVVSYKLSSLHYYLHNEETDIIQLKAIRSKESRKCTVPTEKENAQNTRGVSESVWHTDGDGLPMAQTAQPCKVSMSVNDLLSLLTQS